MAGVGMPTCRHGSPIMEIHGCVTFRFPHRHGLPIRKDEAMEEVRLIEQGIYEMNQRLVSLMKEVRQEREQGLEADWTSVAEGFDSIKGQAEVLAGKAWVVVRESE